MDYQTLEGSFSAVSKPIFTSKHLSYNIFQALHVSHTFSAYPSYVCTVFHQEVLGVFFAGFFQIGIPAFASLLPQKFNNNSSTYLVIILNLSLTSGKYYFFRVEFDVLHRKCRIFTIFPFFLPQNSPRARKPSSE